MKNLIKIVWNNKVTHSIEAESQEQADQFLAKINTLQGWFKHDRWLKESDFTTETVEAAQESRVVTPEIGEVYTEYFFPKEYSIEIIDLTLDPEWQKQQYFSRKEKNKAFGDQIIMDMQWANSSRIKAGTITIQQAIESKESLYYIQGYLRDGDIEIAKGLIESYLANAVVTEEIKAAMIAKINAYLAA